MSALARTRRSDQGYTLLELMVTITVVAIMLALAVPNFANANRVASERRIKQQFVQDFTWARGAAGAADAAALDSSIPGGTPTVTIQINADCSWTTRITSGGTAYVNNAHTMTSAALAAIAPNMSCGAGATALPIASPIQFSTQGYVTSATGTLTMTGGSGQVFTLQILYSGSITQTHAVAGVDS